VSGILGLVGRAFRRLSAELGPSDTVRKPTERYPRQSVPLVEIEAAAGLIRSHPEYFAAPKGEEETYRSLGLTVLADPLGCEVSELAAQALAAREPWSVIRLGDAEMNVLSFGAYNTPYIDRFSVAAAIEQCEDSFLPDEPAMIMLREMMMAAVLQANVVGVRGVGSPWKDNRNEQADAFADRFVGNLRGLLGAWRGSDYILRLARSGFFRHQALASAYLYFGLIKHLDVTVANARRVILITSQPSVLEGLQKRFPACVFELIQVGHPKHRVPLPDQPVFLWEIEAKLPRDLSGCCCLVGAGLWAKFYCSWIKQRGGVALDIGSGFDLLSGAVTRPVHRLLGLDKANPYSL
jgi:hypothetical protein